MPAAYDKFDYISYWLERKYEHDSEVLAIKEIFFKIKKIKTILEVGAGFGRLVSSYSYRAKKIIITDPSSKLLKIARARYTDKKKYKFIHSSLENLPQKLTTKSIDLIIMVRVIHHLRDLNVAFSIINKALKNQGYFILEYPNKKNWKVILREFLRGNFTYPADIEARDLSSPRSIRRHSVPFFNYHPDNIYNLLESNGFKIIEKRSVSNLRSSLLKRILAIDTLLFLERILQKPLATISFGPSIFLLIQKRG